MKCSLHSELACKTRVSLSHSWPMFYILWLVTPLAKFCLQRYLSFFKNIYLMMKLYVQNSYELATK